MPKKFLRLVLFGSGLIILFAAAHVALAAPVTAPVISNVAETGVTGVAANITWTTDVPADSQVSFGTTAGSYPIYSTGRCDGGGLVTTHCVGLVGLTASTLYYYKVTSADGSGTSAFYEKSFITLGGVGGDTQQPTTPSGLGASTSTAQVGLWWAVSTDNVGVVGYKIYRNGTYLASVTTLSYTDTTITTGSTYTYYVVAYDAAGNTSPSSNTISVTTGSSGGAPSVPTISAPSTSATPVYVSWSSATGVTYYNVYHRTPPGSTSGWIYASNGGTLAQNLTGTFFNDTSVTVGASYDYKVNACNTYGCVESNYVAVAVSGGDTTPPAAITNLSAGSPTSNSVMITWTAPGNDGMSGTASSYTVKFSTAAITEATWPNATQVSTTQTPLAAGSTHAMTISGLSPGTTYYFAIKTADSAGNVSGMSNSPSATTAGGGGGSGPNPPASATASSATGKVSVTWPTSGAVKYSIYRSVGGGAYQIWYTNITNVYYDDLSVSQGTTYRYKVYGCNSNGTTCSSVGTESNAVTYSGGNQSCTGLTLTLNDGKTTYTVGDFVNYTWTCSPGGSASNVSMWLQKPDATMTLYNSGSGSTQTMGFSTSNLVPGTHVLKACFDSSCATVTASQTFTMVSPSSVPPTPVNLSIATANSAGSNSTFNLTWGGTTTNVTSFRVYQHLQGTAWPSTYDARDTSQILSSTQTTLTVQVAVLWSGYGTYEFKVRACNSVGCSPDSNYQVITISSGTSSSTVPTAPTNLTATVSSSTTTVYLTWTDNSTNETRFEVYRNPGGGWYYVSYVGSGVTSFFDSPSTGSYLYQVLACNGSTVNTGCSGPSNTYGPITIGSGGGGTVPAAPQLNAPSVSGTMVSLSWGGISGITSYRLFRNGAETTPGAGLSITYTDSGRTNGTYTYYLVACNSYGCSAVSNSQTVTVSAGSNDTSSPTTPQSLVSYGLYPREVDLRWASSTDNVGVVGYYVYRSTNAAWSQIGQTIGASYADTTVQPSSPYYFAVAAFDAAGNRSATSSALFLNTPAATSSTAPAAPSNVVATVSGSMVYLAWTDNSANENWFTVYRQPTGGSWVTLGSVTSNVVSYVDSNVPVGTYTYQVSACGTSLCSSGVNSAAVTVGGGTSATSTLVVPNAPSNLFGAVSGNSVTLTWADNSSNESGFKLYRGPVWTDIGNVGPNSTSYTDSGLSAGVYTYHLNAFTTNGASSPIYSAISNDATVLIGGATTTTAATTVPPPPTLYPITATTFPVSISWSAVGGAASYNLYRSSQTAAAGAWTWIGSNLNGTSYTDSDTSAGGNISYYVAACNATGCSSMSNTVAISVVLTQLTPAVAGWGLSVGSGGASTIGFLFNVAVDVSSLSGDNFFLYPADGDEGARIPSSVQTFTDHVNLLITTPLAAGKSYVAVAKSGLRSVAGVSMANDYRCTFAALTSGYYTSCPGASASSAATSTATTAPTAIILGTIQDPDRKPLAGVGFHLFTKDFATNFGGVSANNGTFAVTLQPATYYLEVFIPANRGDFLKPAIAEVRVAYGESKSVVVAFDSMATISKVITGTVRFSNGSPVADARVGVYSELTRQWTSVTTDINGNYFLSAGRGRWQMSIAPVDATNVRWRWVETSRQISFADDAAAEKITQNFTVVLAATKVVVLTVDQGGKPVADAGIVLDTRGVFDTSAPTVGALPPQFVRTDAVGNATFFVPQGRYYLRGTLPPERGFINPPEQVLVLNDIDARDSRTVQVVFTKPTSVATTVTGVAKLEDDTPVDAFLWGWSERGGFVKGQADEKGNFLLTIAQGDRWHIGAGRDVNGYPYKAAEVPIEATGPSATVNPILSKAFREQLPPPVTVTQEAGQPIVAQMQGGASVVMPESATGGGGTVQVNVTPTGEAPSQASAHVVGAVYDISIKDQAGNVVSQLQKDVEITLPYTDADLTASGATVDKLSPSYFDEKAGTWVKANDFTVDKVRKVVIVRVRHLTRFALVAPADIVPPEPPTKLAAAVTGPSEVTLTWTNPLADFHHAKVYRSTTAANIGTLIDELVTAGSVKDTQATIGTTYFYALKSVDAAGNESKPTAAVKLLVVKKAAAVATTTGAFTGTLQRGVTSASVRTLQQLLINLGFLPKTTGVTGYFGPLTERAVKDFQKANNLEQVGFVGPKTRVLLNSALGR